MLRGDPGSQFRDWIAAEVERVAKRLIGTMSSPVSAQQEGTLVSDGHRLLNFQGAGVSVNDDAANRRVNIVIPGAPITGSSTSTFISTAGTEKVFALTGNNFALAPSGWQNVGFSDASWSASVQMTASVSTFYTIVPGTQWVSNAAGGVTTPAGCLVRRTFTLPSGTISSAVLTLNLDDYLGTDRSLYINGTSIGSLFSNVGWTSGPPLPPQSINITTSLLSAGGTNVLALHVADDNTGITSPHSVSYQLVVTYTNATAPLLSALGSNVTMTSALTFYDGPSLSLSAGTWLITGVATVQNNNATGGNVAAKLWDGTNPPVASADEAPLANGGSASLALSSIVTPTSTTSYKISAMTQQSNGLLRATSALMGTVNATYLMAVRLL